MAEGLIWVKDKAVSANVAFDAMIFKRGDVITIHEDGAYWSPAERQGTDLLASGGSLAGVALLRHPWLIVSVPGVAASLLSAFVASDAGDPAQHILPRLRSFYFDLDTWLAGGRKALAASAALALKLTRTRVSDPNVLTGSSPGLIG